MRLILADARLSHSWEGKWMYLGRDYLRMCAWKRGLPGQQISLSTLIREEAVKQRPKILEWLDRLGEANGDSLSWWMSHLASRNNTASQFFIYLIQIAAAKRWVRENADSDANILVLCEDSFLLRAAASNLGSIARKKAGWELGLLGDVALAARRCLSNLASQVISLIGQARIARRTRPRTPHRMEGEVFLLHHCLDDARFLAKGRLTCRYFTVLPEWLRDHGKQVVGLPWLCNVSLPLDAVYARLRSEDTLITHDWLGWRDYLWALRSALMSYTALRMDIEFDGLDVSDLMNRERRHQRSYGLSLTQFWLYAPALKRWGPSVTRLVMMDPYEAMPPERVQAFAWRSAMPAPSKFIGYCHSLVSADFLGYHTSRRDTLSRTFPDVVVTSGSLGRDLLVRQGMPAERVRVGPALRQLSVADNSAPSDDARRALVLMVSLIPEATVEMLEKMRGLAFWLRDELDVPVIIKGHPMVSNASILELIGWSELPEGWAWHVGDLASALSTAVCAVTLNTASLTDVVIAGCIPCSLTRALDTSWNYFDFLEEDFPVLRAVPDEEIPAQLQQIFGSRRKELQSQTLQVRDHLLRGLSPVNEETMAAFV